MGAEKIGSEILKGVAGKLGEKGLDEATGKILNARLSELKNNNSPSDKEEKAESKNEKKLLDESLKLEKEEEKETKLEENNFKHSNNSSAVGDGTSSRSPSNSSENTLTKPEEAGENQEEREEKRQELKEERQEREEEKQEIKVETDEKIAELKNEEEAELEKAGEKQGPPMYVRFFASIFGIITIGIIDSLVSMIPVAGDFIGLALQLIFWLIPCILMFSLKPYFKILQFIAFDFVFGLVIGTLANVIPVAGDAIIDFVPEAIVIILRLVGGKVLNKFSGEKK